MSWFARGADARQSEAVRIIKDSMTLYKKGATVEAALRLGEALAICRELNPAADGMVLHALGHVHVHLGLQHESLGYFLDARSRLVELSRRSDGEALLMQWRWVEEAFEIPERSL